METVEDLKNDIAKKDAVIRIEQQHLKKMIDNGLFDDADNVLSNPETSNYYQEALVKISDKQEQTIKTSKKENENLWIKFKKNFKKIILQ